MVQRNNKDSSGGSGESVRRSEENVRGVGESAQGVRESAQGVRESAQGVRESAQGVTESSQGVRRVCMELERVYEEERRTLMESGEAYKALRRKLHDCEDRRSLCERIHTHFNTQNPHFSRKPQYKAKPKEHHLVPLGNIKSLMEQQGLHLERVSNGQRRQAGSSTNEHGLTTATLQCEGSAVNKLHRDTGYLLGHASSEGFYVRAAQNSRSCVDRELESQKESSRNEPSLWMKWLRQLHNCPEILEAATSIAFLTFISAVVLNDASPEAVYLKQDLATRIISQHLSPNSTKSFVNIASVEDFWMFAQGPLLHGLFPQATRSSVTHLAGRVRFRQARVDNISCPTTPWLPHVSSSSALSHSQPCYPAYSSLTSSTKPFGFGNGTAWTIVQEEGPAHSGLLTHYSPGGYWLDLPMGLSVAGQALKHLQQEVWLDAASRAVMVDAAVFGPPLWVAGAFHLLVEFPAVGGALSSWELQPVKVNSGTWSASWSLSLACLLLLLQLVNQGRACRSHGWSHMTCPSTWIDLTVIILGCLVLGFGAHDAFNLRPSLFSAIPSPSSFVDLYPTAAWQIHITYLSSSLLLLSWLQGMRYLALCSAWRPLYLALSRAVPHLLATSMLAIFTFLCFAQLSFLMFSTQLPEFSSFFRCMVSQMQLLMGDKDLNKMVQNSCSVFLLCLLLFFFFIILMNLFFAVLCESYGTVRANMAARQSDSQISAFLKKSYQRTFGHVSQPAALDSALAGEGEGEIETTFNRDVEDDGMALRELSHGTSSSVLGFESDSVEEEDDEPHEVSNEEFQILSRRVCQLEHSIGSAVSKMDAVIVKLSALEKERARRSELIGQLLRAGQQETDNPDCWEGEGGQFHNSEPPTPSEH